MNLYAISYVLGEQGFGLVYVIRERLELENGWSGAERLFRTLYMYMFASLLIVIIDPYPHGVTRYEGVLLEKEMFISSLWMIRNDQVGTVFVTI